MLDFITLRTQYFNEVQEGVYLVFIKGNKTVRKVRAPQQLRRIKWRQSKGNIELLVLTYEEKSSLRKACHEFPRGSKTLS